MTITSETTPDDDLGRLELLDWWELHRWTAKELCSAESARLKATVEETVRSLPVGEIVASSSEERAKIEFYLAQEIIRVEAELTKRLAGEFDAFTQGMPTAPMIAGYDGWSFWDLGQIVIGGGAPAAMALAGGRAATGLLAAAGLAAVAAPVTITVAVVGLVWSAYSTVDGKRAAYLEALTNEIDRVLLIDPEASVLARHHAVLDQIRKAKTGDA